MRQAIYFSATFIFLTTHLIAQNASNWTTIQVPGAWQGSVAEEIKARSGFAWYRTWFKPTDIFFQPHERNLFEESVSISIGDLGGAHEIFVNGKKIGRGGQFPPAFQNGGKELHRHKIPAGTLRKGEWNEIAIRVYNEGGPGGFLGEAPFVMCYFDECVLEGAWEIQPGDNYQPGGALKDKPARSAFDKFQRSSRALGRSAEFVTGDKLPPQESFQKMTAADDLAVDLLLHEPAVAQPVHFSFDERGRLWVAQYRQYPYPAGLKMLSRDQYYRSHYDKVPPAPPNHDRGADIISIHESSRGDGVFDQRKIFLEGLNMANAAVRGRGGVWVMHTPYLLFYPDKNFDDVPDGPPTVHLAGFGLEDTHSVANGLVWGMDGWLYGCQGSTTSSRVSRPGIDAADFAGVYFEGCMVWRYHPETRAYEIFAEGGGNNFGLEIDAQGRLFSGHNGGTTRGWNFIQGGFYLMQGVDPGKFGPPRNPYAFGDLPLMKADSSIVRFSHFGAFAEGTSLPSKYAGMLLSIDPLHNVVIASKRIASGANFSTSDVGPLLKSEDKAFRPVYIANAPDGSIFIADMYEHYIAHGQHYQSQIDPNSGRIYRLRGKAAKLETDLNLAAKTSDELVALLSHSNKWHRHTAVRLLGERHDSKSAKKLRLLIEKDAGIAALNGLWALHQSTGLDDATAIKALQHPYAPVRWWTVRLLGDKYGVHRGLGVGVHASSRGKLPGKIFAALLAQAELEKDAEVCAQIASTARRFESQQTFPLLAAVLKKDEFANDPFIPLLCWWGFEAHIPTANKEVLALFKQPALWDEPIVFEHLLPRLARRYAIENKRQDLLNCAQLFRTAPTPKHAAQLMKGFEEAFRGRAMSGMPEELVSAITASGQAPLIFRVKQGENAAITEALKLLQSASAKIEERLLYARTFGEVRHAEAVPALLEVASTNSADALRKAALVSLAAYDEERIGDTVLSFLSALSSEVRPAAFTLLTSRTKWSLQLLAAIESGKIEKGIVLPEIADRLRTSKEKAIHELATKLFSAPVAASREFQKRLEEIQKVVKQSAGSPYAGEAIFNERCASCHKLFFKGGNIAPDLTDYQRDNLDTMLVSIINPNAEIREGFQHFTVETKDERSLSGFFVERDNQVLVLRGLDGENITLRATEVKSVQATGRSLMPEGLLDGLTDQQLRDFFAFMRISQPISR